MNTNPQAATRGRILVIDDEVAILVTMKRFLQSAGYEVQTAASGLEGLSLFQQGTWDVVTVDRSMPEMNGEEVALSIHHLVPEVPVILITGFPGAVTRPELFHAIIGKPFQFAELLRRLENAAPKRNECPT
jgi:DNA-binding response OmpR family regulator